MSRQNNRLLLLLLAAGAIYFLHLGLQRNSTPHIARTTTTIPSQPHPNGHNFLGEHSGTGAKDRTKDSHKHGTGHLTDHPLRTTNLDIDFPDIQVDERGHVAYDPVAHATAHPIKLLMDRAKKQVAQLEDRLKSVHTLQDAVNDYERAWKMKPPKGFEVWYEFVRRHNSVPLASAFPMAHKPFLQFLSLSAKVLRARVKENEAKEPMYTLTFVPEGKGDEGTQCDEDGTWAPKDWHSRGRGRVLVGGPWAWEWRCNNTLTLMLPLLAKFPDEFFTMDPPLKLVFNSDDGPRGMVHNDFQQRSETYGQAGKTWPEAQLQAADQRLKWTYGWQWTCPSDSPLKQASLSTVLNEQDENEGTLGGKTFIGDFYMSLDVCYNPELRHQNSFALNDQRLANNPLGPYISVARSLRNTDICMIPLDAVYQTPDMVEWKDKTQARVFWRGSPTGLSHKKGNGWRNSQRHRLNFFTNNQSDAAIPILVQRGNTVRAEAHRIKDMNEKWFDVGLAGGAVQCNKADGSCDELANTVPWKDIVRGSGSLQYKYVVDVDGNAWSSRFRRLMLSNHCVFKSTAYPEWFNDILVPWYHYVPIRHDYTDLYDIMAYFEGAPDGSTKGHTELAGEIALNGHNFVKEHWRVPDMQSFMILIFLEFFRLFSDDREAASFA